MSTAVSAPVAAAPATKYLWGAVGVLGVCTLAMGAALVQMHHRPVAAEAPLEVLAISTPAPVSPESATVAAPPAALAPPAAVVAEKKASKPASASEKYASSAPKVIAKKPVATGTPAPAPAPAPAPEAMPAVAPAAPVATAPVLPPAKAVCANCGVVEAVTAVQRESANPSGAGAVAGAVLGGLVGNQFGGGDGKALATIAGVLGGGWAGNTVEKRLKKETVYLVDVRMEDGSLRSVEQSTAPALGQSVRVEGNRISPAPTVSDRNSGAISSST